MLEGEQILPLHRLRSSWTGVSKRRVSSLEKVRTRDTGASITTPKPVSGNHPVYVVRRPRWDDVLLFRSHSRTQLPRIRLQKDFYYNRFQRAGRLLRMPICAKSFLKLSPCGYLPRAKCGWLLILYTTSRLPYRHVYRLQFGIYLQHTSAAIYNFWEIFQSFFPPCLFSFHV
jgi:hypothetical protein